jgi:hypothetical protein
MNSTRTLPLALAFALMAGPALADPPGYITAVMAGLPDSAGKVPTFNGVPGAAVTNLDVAVPVAHLIHGIVFTYTVAQQNNSFSGNCHTQYMITQMIGGKRTIIDRHAIKQFNCKANTIYSWSITANPVPNNPGPATLTGLVNFGGQMVKFSVPLTIE